MVTRRGVEMVEGWPEEIEAAQKNRVVWLDGELHQRIPHDGAAPCWDCACLPGELHVPRCCVERCACGCVRQAMCVTPDAALEA